MSISVMTAIWRTCLFQGNTLNVLLAMGDFAEDDGGDIFPGLDLLAAKSRASIRTTQNALRELEGAQVIEQIANARGGRGRVTEYRIDLERVRELQALHEAENPACEHCQAKRRSAEKRVQHRAQRVQRAAGKGAASYQKGANSREHIDNTHQDPSLTHQHPPAPDGAVSGEGARALGKGSPERFREFRDAWAATVPGGFPARSEAAAEAEFVRQTRMDVPADRLIAAARLHGVSETRRKAARRGGDFRTMLPSNWLRERAWQGYLSDLERGHQAEGGRLEALAAVMDALGDDVVTLMRRSGMRDSEISLLEGVAFVPGPEPRFTSVRAFPMTILQQHHQQLCGVFGDGLRIMRARQAG